MMPTDAKSWRRACTAVCLGLVLLALGCDSANGSDPCAESGGAPLLLEAGTCLVFDDPGRLGAHRSPIEQTVRQTVSAVNQVMPTPNLLIRVVADPSQVIPELGLSGYNPSAGEVILYVDPGSSMLPQSLTTDLSAVVAHEMHHARRRRAVGYGSTLFEAAVSEGLADHFSMEVIGTKPPLWAKALTGAELETWMARARETWADRPYDHRAWFVGTDPAIPRWTGYAIGFELVRNYLAANTGRRASGLVGEPASSFLPTASRR